MLGNIPCNFQKLEDQNYSESPYGTPKVGDMSSGNPLGDKDNAHDANASGAHAPIGGSYRRAEAWFLDQQRSAAC